MGSEPLQQSAELELPFIRVGRDDSGGAVWEVVGGGCVVRTPSGHRALAILETMTKAQGITA